MVKCPVFEIMYGGARGGGKTDGMLGKFANKAGRYGEHCIGVFFRRTREDLKEAVERSKQIYAPLGAKLVSERQWRFPNGARLKFEYLDRDKDADNYQGHSYCVALGTRIRMADGSLREIERVRPGDMVATLEGAKRVLRTTPPYRAECVEYEVHGEGRLIGKQVHPATHPVLSIASGRQKPSDGTRHSGVQLPPAHAPWLSVRPHPDVDQGRGVESAWLGDVASDCEGSGGKRPDGQQPLVLSVPVALAEPWIPKCTTCSGASIQCRTDDRCGSLLREKYQSGRTAVIQGWQRLCGHGQPLSDRIASIAGDLTAIPWRCALAGSLQVEDWPVGCLLGRRSDGVRLPGRSATGPGDAPSQGDAARRGRDGSASGETGCIHERTPPLSSEYIHPYSGARRRQEVPTVLGHAKVRFVGESLVSDLTVEDANHYITECGLINKNTDVFMEELTHWPDPTPVNKLKATLRSAHGVPCQFHATCNPGGPGHLWVKERYIDPAPGGWKILREEFENPFDGTTQTLERVFIPSRLTDNRLLLDSDPMYVAKLQQSGSKELVRAWLEGDWDIVVGAYFDCWNEWKARGGLVKPFTIPKHWVRFRSFDWGSARPFSVGWWAVASEHYEPLNIPTGALVRYREWYGASKANVGLKLDAEQVADGIVQRTEETIDYSVADPAIFSVDGGPSIAERMARRGVAFRRGDNRRVGKLGHSVGWDQVRSRFNGDDRPMMYVFDTCTDFVRTMPALQHDETRPEDIDTDGEDHVADEVRYACMSRPWTRALPPKPMGAIAKASGAPTFNEMLERSKRRRANVS